MTLEEEIIFFIQAKQKATESKTENLFRSRLITLFLEGQISEEGYKILNEIFRYQTKPVSKPSTIVKNIVNSDPCSRGDGSSRIGGC